MLAPVPVGVVIAMSDEEGGLRSVVALVAVAAAEKEITGALCGREGTTGTWALMKMFMIRR